MREKPAFIIAAAKSGSGKTTLTLGIVAALVQRGLDIRCFKCGPDFIDPTLHRSITSKVSYNLDLRMMGVDCCRRTFASKSAAADAVVIEGVMGLFDGGEASTAALAKALNVPVILIIDAGSMAESAAAVLNGFLSFDPELDIPGVIFNRIGSPRHRQLIYQAVKQHCKIGYCGFFGRDGRYTIAERHLGLHMGFEDPLGQEGLSALVDAVEHDLNVDRLLDVAGSMTVDALSDENVEPALDSLGRTRARCKKLRLGVAYDEAFCFYYPQNLELFESRGFEIVRFSPLRDIVLPPNLDMLYFGGGYPENFAGQLSGNQSMCQQIIAAHKRELPIYGECGGFMYLSRSLADMESNVYQMVGIFPCHTSMKRRLRKLGYRRATLQKDCILGSRGDQLHGHEFHYSEIVVGPKNREILNKLEPLYLLDNNSHEGYSVGAALGSYVHLHFGKTESVIDRIYDQLSENGTL